jgi:putative ABC transport system ATP-binding protein
MELKKMLVVENISKKFYIGGKEKKVLDGVNLEIKKGEVVAITGKSGEGKSTLLNIISGLIKPDSGRVYFNGRRVIFFLDIHPAYLRNRNIGFVFQTFRLLPQESVWYNLLLPAMIKGFVGKRIKERALKLLKDFDLGDFKNMKAGLLSGGQKQRLAIARALINDPSLILADEPVANLDLETAKEIEKILLDVVSSGKAMVIVTHQLEVIKSADKRFELKAGKLESFDGKDFSFN